MNIAETYMLMEIVKSCVVLGPIGKPYHDKAMEILEACRPDRSKPQAVPAEPKQEKLDV